MSIMKRMVLGEQCPAITGYPPRPVPLDLNVGDVIRSGLSSEHLRITSVDARGGGSASLWLEVVGTATDERIWRIWPNVQQWDDGRYTTKAALGRPQEIYVVSRATAQLALF